ncbi:MAG: 2-phosphosulfolactate phosphatase [Pirellulaceae bacterium]|jgi:2-phosphosulfolactate phosphatase
MEADVYFLPELLQPSDIEGRIAVVIDVLRATTTINFALVAGADSVRPCLEVEQARELASGIDNALLGGERGGLPIEGFDLGNSPQLYMPDVVSGKTIVFTTTNGTKALQACCSAERVLIGAFVNLVGLVLQLKQTETPLAIVCSGTNGEVTREDVLMAGALVHELSKECEVNLGNDQAILALDAWRSLGERGECRERLAEELQQTQGGRNLMSLGLQDDIVLSALRDRFRIVPELDTADWSIRLN